MNSLQYISLKAAQSLVLSHSSLLAQEIIGLDKALGRVLVHDVFATIDLPPFDASAVDGYAWSGNAAIADSQGRVTVALLDTIFAGRVGNTLSIKADQCAKIMTGAPLPSGAGAVQCVERATLIHKNSKDFVRFIPEPKANIIQRGGNQMAGSMLLGPRILQAQDLALLASSGYNNITIRKKLKAKVFSTGNELIKVGNNLPRDRIGAIYDSNGPMLFGQLQSLGCEVSGPFILPDDKKAIAAAIKDSLQEEDMLIFSGAVSKGDADYVPSVLKECGAEIIFHGVNMRPGSPSCFGKFRQGTTVFGLAGNPLSTFVGFIYLVLPHIYARMGLAFATRYVRAFLEAPISRKDTEGVRIIPACLHYKNGTNYVQATECVGSFMLSSLASSDCLMCMEDTIQYLEAGSAVDVRLIRP